MQCTLGFTIFLLAFVHSQAVPGVVPNNAINSINPEINSNQDDSIISLSSKSPTGVCKVIEIKVPCHECTQHDFQLNVDECHATHYVEKVKCEPVEDEDEGRTKTQSCQPNRAHPESIWPFWLLSLTSGTVFWVVSRRRQRFLDDKRNRKLTQQLQSL